MVTIIREGLEKMEREKQKQLEKEQQNNDNTNSSDEDNTPDKNILTKSLSSTNDGVSIRQIKTSNGFLCYNNI